MIRINLKKFQKSANDIAPYASTPSDFIDILTPGQLIEFAALVRDFDLQFVPIRKEYNSVESIGHKSPYYECPQDSDFSDEIDRGFDVPSLDVFLVFPAVELELF